MKEQFNLKEKTILIIGASGRIGSEICEALSHTGANIVAADIEGSKLKEESSSYLPLKVDITDINSIKNVFKESLKKFSKIDSAINVSYPKNKNYGSLFENVKYEDFCENVSLHLGGYFLFMQQCVDYSLKNEVKFSLVNFSSIYGVISPRFKIYSETDMTLPVEYAAMKSAIQHLSLYVSSYTKGSEFRVNCISPGGILDDQNQLFLKRYKSLSRKKGMLDPEDLVGTVLYLCSNLSEYVCGQNIIVDDGFSV